MSASLSNPVNYRAPILHSVSHRQSERFDVEMFAKTFLVLALALRLGAGKEFVSFKAFDLNRRSLKLALASDRDRRIGDMSVCNGTMDSDYVTSCEHEIDFQTFVRALICFGGCITQRQTPQVRQTVP